MSENQLSTILAQSMRELEFPQAFGLVPWGHHIDIIEHCQSIDEALFYIKKTIEGGWSRNTLMNCIKGHYYENLGGAITNFADKLPSPQSELAQASGLLAEGYFIDACGKHRRGVFKGRSEILAIDHH